MIAKVENRDGKFQRWDNCLTACFTEDEETNEFVLICSYVNGKDYTYPLDTGDKVYLMNDEGKTIDRVVV